MVKLAGLLVALVVISPVVTAAYSSLIAVSPGKLNHLFVSGSGLSVNPNDTKTPNRFVQHLKVTPTTDPHNGTVCWVEGDPGRAYRYTQSDSWYPGVLQCYKLGYPTVAWELKMPAWLAIKKLKAIAFDWAAQTWHLTTLDQHTNWTTPLWIWRSYVCTYRFGRCLTLSTSVSKERVLGSFAAYDMTNRSLFRIGARGLESVRLDGSGARVIPVTIEYPKGLVVDPVGRHIYWVTAKNGQLKLTRVDYDGSNMKEVTISRRRRLPLAVDFPGAVVFVGYNEMLSVVRVKGDAGTDTAEGSVSREAVRQLVALQSLISIHVISDIQEDAESVISSCQDCQDICVPTSVEGAANVTCFCQHGYEIAQLQCVKQQPGYVVVAAANSLQAFDLKTEKVNTILSGLTDATKVDYLWQGGDRFQLFWLDDGSLFRGDWSPVGTDVVSVTDVQTVVQATDTEQIVEVAVDWHQRNLLWMKTGQDPQYGNLILTEMAALNGSFVRTLFVGPWEGQNQDLVIHRSGRYSVFVEGGTAHWRRQWGKLRGGSVTCYPRLVTGSDIAEIVIDTSASNNEHGKLDQVIWIDRDKRALFVSHQSAEGHTRLHLQPEYRGTMMLTHPTLGHAGGLDVLDGWVFWTDRSSDQLWMAHTDTSSHVRPLAIAGGRGVRLLHPRRQPRADSNGCDDSNGGCSHFCVRGLRGLGSLEPVPQCTCPNGMMLLDGGHKTCQPVGSAREMAQFVFMQGGEISITKFTGCLTGASVPSK